MWKQDKNGRWSYGTWKESNDFAATLVNKALFKPDQNDDNAAVYVPIQTLEDAYHEHRLFKYIDKAPHRSGFWVEGWFDPEQAIKDYFPNRALVDYASAPLPVVRNTPTNRSPRDYASGATVGRDYALDNTLVEQGARVLVKDQWYETLTTYDITLYDGPRAVRFQDNGDLALEFLTENNLVEFYDADGKIVHTDRINNLERRGPVDQNDPDQNAYVRFNTLADVPPEAVSCADPLDGDWQRTKRYDTAGVFKYVGDKLVPEPDLDTEDGRFHYTVWVSHGETNTNAQFFLERLGAEEIDAILFDVKQPVPPGTPASVRIINGLEVAVCYPALAGFYPSLPEHPKKFSPGSAYLIKHELAYNINKVAVQADDVEPRVRFAVLDTDIARKSVIRATYLPGTIEAHTLQDQEDYLVFSSTDDALALDNAYRFPGVTPNMTFTLDSAVQQTAGRGEDMFKAPNKLILPPTMLVAAGDLMQLRAGGYDDVPGDRAYDEPLNDTVAVVSVTLNSTTNKKEVVFTPKLTGTLAEFVRQRGVGLVVRGLNKAARVPELVDNINFSHIGKHYQFNFDVLTGDTIVHVRDYPNFAYADRSVTINAIGIGGSGSTLIAPITLDDPAWHGGYYPIYTTGYTLDNLLTKAGVNQGNTGAAATTLPLYHFPTLPPINEYTYHNDETSRSRVGKEGRYLIFGEDLLTDPYIHPNSPLGILPGMEIRIDGLLTTNTYSGTEIVYVETCTMRTTVRNNVAYKEYVVRISAPVVPGTVQPSPQQLMRITTYGGINSPGHLQSVVHDLSDQAVNKNYAHPQEFLARAMARDHYFRHKLSGFLFTDGQRELRTFNYVAETPDIYTNPAFPLADARSKFDPIEAARLGIEGKVGAAVLLETGKDWQRLDDQMFIVPDAAKSRRIRFVDGLDEDKIRNDVDGQGKYSWILNPGVIAVGAVVGCTGKNGTGTLIWYTGEWRSGVWEDGIWYSGTWRTGLWMQGSWFSYLVNVTPNSVRVNFASQRNSYSIWRGGTWTTGFWNGGEWRRGEWLAGTFNFGSWVSGNWHDGKWYGGVWHAGTWTKGEWFGGDFQTGIWKSGTWNTEGGILKQVSRFGTTASVENGRAFWYGGTWKGGVFMSGANSTDHLASVWWNGIWEGGTWLGGTFVLGRWGSGDWYNGVWLGGYRVKTDNTHKLTNPNPFVTYGNGASSTDIDSPGSGNKRLTLEVGMYDDVLGVTNTSHHLVPSDHCYFLGRSATSPLTANSVYPNQQPYLPKSISSLPDNLPDALAVYVNYAPIAGDTWDVENAATGVLDGGPFLVPSFHGGTWHGGIWRNGVFDGGTWLGGLWVDGLVTGGTMGTI